MVTVMENPKEKALKAVVLAAGKASIHPDRPLILEMLGNKSILQLVLDNALELVAPQDLDEARELLDSAEAGHLRLPDEPDNEPELP